MKKFFICLSVIVVALLSITDLRQRLSELDSITKDVQVKREVYQNSNNNSYDNKQEANKLKTCK